MRVRTRCWRNPAALLLVALLSIPFSASSGQSHWDRYKPGTIAAIMAAHDSTVFPYPVNGRTNFMVSGDHFPTLASVIYTGQSRPLDPTRALVVRQWSMAFLRDTSMLNDFHREYLFQEGKQTIWLPVQDTVASYFASELKAGQTARLYVMFLGAQRANGETVWAFAVNEFEAEPVQSVAAGTVSQQSMPDQEQPMSLKIKSPAFQPKGLIPSQYTCEGQDVSPPLSWSGAPSNTKSIALIVDDPDAPDPAKPQRVYVHWVVYNIPPGTIALPENASKTGMPKGAVQGKNDWGKAAYGGPCPPIGRHRYFFKLYALDTELTGLSEATKADLERAMKGHVVDSGELIGTYQKSAKK